ncbi:MAG TPA: histidine kinase [Chitinophagaceae bacterium]|nr:histidine kinase [Chitinophagaceae bacterium]
MKKIILIAGLLCIFLNQSFAQSGQKRWDQIVDSVRAGYLNAKDSARVDYLIELCESLEFSFPYNAPQFYTKGDTTVKYASMALEEATRLGYKYGIGRALIKLAWAEGFKGFNDPKRVNNDTVEARLKRALAIGEEIGSDRLLGYLYLQKGPQEKANFYFARSGDLNRQLEALTNIVWNYTNGEESVEGIEYADSALRVAQRVKPRNPWDHELIQWAYSNMSELYKTAGDFETSMEYVKKSDSIGKLTDGMREPYNMCELNYFVGKYDSALHYWELWKKDYDGYYFGYKAKGDLLLAKILMKKGEYDKAITTINGAINILVTEGKTRRLHEYGLIRPLLGLGEAYTGKKDYLTASKYTKEGLGYAKKLNDRTGKMEGYDLMSRIYHGLGNNDSAYWYVRSYMSMKDSLQNKQFIWRLNNYKKVAEVTRKEAQINLLNKDNKIKAQQLKQEATLKYFLLALLLTFMIAGIYVYRNISLKRKNEKLIRAQKEQLWEIQQLESNRKQNELQAQAAELEMQALRAQMNPHFIFNCLSSINRFILKNESKTASNYLTRFSRLIRMVLINSTKQMITLEDDLQMLKLYLEMEQMRFKDSFEFSITYQNVIDDDNIFIPPLLIQPFCENAIWHGLMHKDGPGKLEINLGLDNNILHCIITDNGVGREKAGEIKSKSAQIEKSLGLKITTDRLALLNREKGVNTSYRIEDLYDEDGHAAGTRVELMISFKETIEERVS